MKTNNNNVENNNEKLNNAAVKPEIEQFMEDEMLGMCGGKEALKQDVPNKTCNCAAFASA